MSVTAWLPEYWCLCTAGPADHKRLEVEDPGQWRGCGASGKERRRRLTLHQVLMVDGGQVGQVLLQVRAELGVRVDLHQLLLAARLLAVEVGHVLLRLGADL